MAAWQCGWPCRGIQGNGPSTDFQGLEKINDDLKRSLPAQFHGSSLSTVTPRGVRRKVGQRSRQDQGETGNQEGSQVAGGKVNMATLNHGGAHATKADLYP